MREVNIAQSANILALTRSSHRTRSTTNHLTLFAFLKEAIAHAGVRFVLGEAVMENLVGIVQGLRGRTADTIYDLFFAERRGVAAIVVHWSDFAQAYLKRDAFRFLFGGFLRQREVKAQCLRLIKQRREAFKVKALDDILKMHEANIEIDFKKVVFAKVRKGFFESSLTFIIHNNQDRKLEFWLPESEVDRTEQLITAIFPNKLK